MADNVFFLRAFTEVRNVRKSSRIGKGNPGAYWTKSVKAAICDDRIDDEDDDFCGVACKDYGCSNVSCGNDAVLAGHVWMGNNITDMFLIPICSDCNNNFKLRFSVARGCLVVEEERADIYETLRSAWKRFKDYANSSSDSESGSGSDSGSSSGSDSD